MILLWSFYQIFAKFVIPKSMQNDFPKWSRKIMSDAFKIPPPPSQIHPSCDVKVPAPEGIIPLLAENGVQKSNPTEAASTALQSVPAPSIT